jgi:hypothetical protein
MQRAQNDHIWSVLVTGATIGTDVQAGRIEMFYTIKMIIAPSAFAG